MSTTCFHSLISSFSKLSFGTVWKVNILIKQLFSLPVIHIFVLVYVSVEWSHALWFSIFGTEILLWFYSTSPRVSKCVVFAKTYILYSFEKCLSFIWECYFIHLSDISKWGNHYSCISCDNSNWGICLGYEVLCSVGRNCP